MSLSTNIIGPNESGARDTNGHMVATRKLKTEHFKIEPYGVVCNVPNNVKPLGIKVIGTTPVVFVEYDPSLPVVETWFKLVLMGQVLESSLNVSAPAYVDSFLVPTENGTAVFHLYQVYEKFIISPPGT